MTQAATPEARAAVGRRWLAPEVVQTSAMDCGPAALRCLLEGFGIRASYGRLREACQTDVDGTSIDALEDAALALGLDAEQVMVPAEHLLLPEAGLLPALVVVRAPGGLTHFIVAWRRHGPLVQVMDPAAGRRWTSVRRFLEDLYTHELAVPAAAWREWAGSPAFLVPLRARLAALGVAKAAVDLRVDAALADPSWRALGALDAAVRTVESLARAGGARAGAEAASLLERLCEPADGVASDAVLPDACWSVRPDDGDEATLRLRGAVLMHVAGRRAPERDAASLSPEFAAVLEEPPAQPARELVRLLRADGLLTPLSLGAALVLAAGGLLLEALLFRALLDLSSELGLSGQRVAALGGLLVFAAGLLLLELPIAAGLLRLGRRLELRLQMAVLEVLPRLGDRYLASRLASDLAERSHAAHQIRWAPELGGELVRAGVELVLTAAAIAWLAPSLTPLALLAAALALCVPFAAQPVLAERDLRVREHAGALTRFVLDALLGIVPVRAHAAERAVRREHEGLLGEWARAGFRLQRAAVAFQGVQLAAGFGLAAALLFRYAAGASEPALALLLVYWALQLPMLGLELADLARRYPPLHNLTLRVLEPLLAKPETGEAAETAASPPLAEDATGAAPGAAIAFESASVRVAGHTVLDAIDLAIAPGSQVAVIGASGAGKSTLLGCLLGWHRTASGRLRVDGAELDAARLARLRADTAWLDPAVQLWNRSLLDNLRYGAPPDAAHLIALDAAELRELLEELPEGLQTQLGEGGGLLSGGEGQRVRLGRALLRRGARLVLLDEPFRGLERERRRALLARARRWWSGSTLICVTHDAAETRDFDHVVVLEGGRLVEQGPPAELAAKPGSRYAALLEAAERPVFTAAAGWRRLRLERGQLVELAAPALPAAP